VAEAGLVVTLLDLIIGVLRFTPSERHLDRFGWLFEGSGKVFVCRV
jgi:hypothetical protein